MLRTEDGGATWEQQANGPAASRGIRCADALTCVATTPSGQSLMRTIDGGATFTSVSPSSTKLLAAAFAVGPAGRCGGGGRRHRGVRRRRRDLAPLGERLSQTFTRIRAVSASLVFAVGPNGTLARTSDGGSLVVRRSASPPPRT